MVDNERQCIGITEYRAELRRRGGVAQQRLRVQDEEYNEAMNKDKLKRLVQLEDRKKGGDREDEEDDNENDKFAIILKADSTGTLIALEKCFSETVAKYNDDVDVYVLNTGTGDISATDIYAASDSGAIIYGFNSKLTKEAKSLAQQNDVEIINHKIIYRLEDDLNDKLTSMMPQIESESFSGRAEVLDTFEINGKNRGTKYQINGMKVTSGTIKNKQVYRVFRDDELIYDHLEVKTMRIFKDDATQVGSGGECGIQLVPIEINTASTANEGGDEDGKKDDDVAVMIWKWKVYMVLNCNLVILLKVIQLIWYQKNCDIYMYTILYVFLCIRSSSKNEEMRERERERRKICRRCVI